MLSQWPPKEFCLSGNHVLHTASDQIIRTHTHSWHQMEMSCFVCYIFISIAFERWKKKKIQRNQFSILLHWSHKLVDVFFCGTPAEVYNTCNMQKEIAFEFLLSIVSLSLIIVFTICRNFFFPLSLCISHVRCVGRSEINIFSFYCGFNSIFISFHVPNKIDCIYFTHAHI